MKGSDGTADEEVGDRRGEVGGGDEFDKAGNLKDERGFRVNATVADVVKEVHGKAKGTNGAGLLGG